MPGRVRARLQSWAEEEAERTEREGKGRKTVKDIVAVLPLLKLPAAKEEKAPAAVRCKRKSKKIAAKGEILKDFQVKGASFFFAFCMHPKVSFLLLLP